MKRTLSGSLIVLLALACLPCARAGSTTDPAEWVPANAVMYVGITDVQRTWNAFKETGSYKFVTDPVIAQTGSRMNLVATTIDDVRTRIANMLGVKPEDLKNPFGGALAVYLHAPPGGGPDQLQPCVIADVTDGETMRTYFDKFIDTLSEREERKHRRVSSGSATIHVFTVREGFEPGGEQDEFAEFDEQPSPAGMLGPSPDKMIKEALDKAFSLESLPASFALCLTDRQFIVTGSAELAESILNQRGPKLAESPDYQALLRNLKPIGTVRMVFNLPRIVELAGAGTAGGAEMQEWLRLLGADSLRSAVGHMKIGAASYDSKFELLFLMQQQRKGLARLLSMENGPTAPPPEIGADALLYMGVRVDIPRLLDEIESMVRETDPQSADQMRAQLAAVGMPDGQTVNLRQEVLAHLQGPLSMSLAASRPLALETTMLKIMLGHNDQAAMTRFLSHFAGMLMPREQGRGAQIFDVALPFPGIAGNSVAVTSDRLIISKTAAIEQLATSNVATPLAQTSGWQRAARFVPEQSWFTLYEDRHRMMEAALDAVRNQETIAAAGGMDPAVMLLIGSLGDLSEHLADDTQPEIEKLLKHAADQIVTISTTPEGVQLTAVALKPRD